MAIGARTSRNLLLRSSILAAMGALGYGCTSTVTTFSEGSGGATSSSPSSNATNTSSSNSSSSSGIPAGVCEGADPIIEGDGTESGYARCPDGTVHRYDASIACSADVAAPACSGMEAEVSCLSDADCNAAPNGQCRVYTYAGFGGDTTACGCIYPCTTDADCDPGYACLCDGVMNDGVAWSTCVQAGCADNSDCASGECGASSYSDGCGEIAGLGCRADSDACRLDSDCQPSESCSLQYGVEPWVCAIGDCAVGRPLLLADGARTAHTTARGDWTTPVAPNLDLDGPVREALAAHWERVAALEHASVASFARFSLQLLALGAPAALLADTQAAAADEVEHARLAYALASAYSGREQGPGPLDLSDMRITTSRRAAMLELVAEACVGETLGVAEARELAAIVRDPAVRSIHARIADDEQRHAELAWRAMAWMLRDADDALRGEVRAAFDAAAAANGAAVPADPNVLAAHHGLLSGVELAALRRRALAEVVLPCAAALFA